MDFVEGLPQSREFNALWVVVDRLTKVAPFIHISHPYYANILADFFIKHVFKLYGMPTSIISKQHLAFTSKFGRKFSQYKGCNWLLASPTTPKVMDKQKQLTNG